jgi:putative addiction module killer protein
MERTILIFERSDGKCPFQDWLLNLRDVKARATIRARLERVRLGNLGDCKSLRGGILELRITYGPGYRVYMGFDGTTFVVLLCGGDKGSQKRDITKARVLWEEYKNASKKLPK